jgi:hypothetical protein
MAVGSSLLLEQLSGWLGEEAVAARHTLRSLRLSGSLHLATVFGRIAPFAAEFRLLEVGTPVVQSLPGAAARGRTLLWLSSKEERVAAPGS